MTWLCHARLAGTGLGKMPWTPFSFATLQGQLNLGETGASVMASLRVSCAEGAPARPTCRAQALILGKGWSVCGVAKLRAQWGKVGQSATCSG